MVRQCRTSYSKRKVISLFYMFFYLFTDLKKPYRTIHFQEYLRLYLNGYSRSSEGLYLNPRKEGRHVTQCTSFIGARAVFFYNDLSSTAQFISNPN